MTYATALPNPFLADLVELAELADDAAVLNSIMSELEIAIAVNDVLIADNEASEALAFLEQPPLFLRTPSFGSGPAWRRPEPKKESWLSHVVSWLTPEFGYQGQYQ
jgi:hypothetical protein